jgi:hypothetical protein
MSDKQTSERKPARQLYYITHIDNLPSILKYGILSHQQIVSRKINYTQIYNEDIVQNRQGITTPDGRSLWSFTNLYFQARNPMLFQVKFEASYDSICVLGVDRSILSRKDIYVSDGNAASMNSKISPPSPSMISVIDKQVDKVWWTEIGGKRKIMAECLVPDQVPPEHVKSIYVANHQVKEKVEQIISSPNIPVIFEPDMFFQPAWKINLTPTLSVLEGDMFFSEKQTLTISVNSVGIMGKGLASRTKYLFPDVYVFYQDICRRHALELGKPFLYKREASFDYQLADEPSFLPSLNTHTWFLLFPTKRHWRERADLRGIRKGLEWIEKNYKKMKLESLALPALGCGLGRLEWQEVGPILCAHMSRLKIPVWIYLPAEKKIPKDLLSKDFLLKGRLT